MLVAISIALYAKEFMPWNVIILSIIYLAGKTIVFHKDIASLLDGFVVIVLVLQLIGIANDILLFICILYLLQKALRSFT